MKKKKVGPHILPNGTRIWYPNLSNINPGSEIGENCVIHSSVWIGAGVKIGARTKVQAFVFIPEGISLGEGCFIGPHVCFTNDKNPPGGRSNWQKTDIGRDVKIGANATILPGITIGEGAVIGAGAVVVKNVAPYMVVVGNPAKPIKKRKKRKQKRS